MSQFEDAQHRGPACSTKKRILFHLALYGFSPNCQNKNEYISVLSSICLARGLPWPCPALVSMRNRMGLFLLAPFLASACISAAIFLACMGSTRVSVSPVI